jgi:hypothetical protein
LQDKKNLLSEIYQQSAVAMVTLKKRNRMQFLELERKKSMVDSHRERIGQAQLKLENLLYKESYLLREIQNCQQISTPAIQTIEDELQDSIAIDNYSVDLNAKHKIRLEMLRSELIRRRNKQATVLEEQGVKSEMEDTLHKKQKLLEGIPEKLSAVATSSRQLYDFFEGGSEIATMDTNLDRCRHLPSPLYVLFRSLSVLCQKGEDAAECRSASVSVQPVDSSSVAREGAGEAEQELAVDLRLQLGGIGHTQEELSTGKADLVLRFRHCSHSNLVFVAVLSITLLRSSGAGSEIAVPFRRVHWLKTIFPQSVKANESIHDNTTPAASEEMGSAYLWAQWLCGLRPLPPVCPSHETSRDGGELVVSLPCVVAMVTHKLFASHFLTTSLLFD